MKNLTAASRITIGLVCSMVGILITANFLGLLPDQNVVITQGRAQLTESLAFSTSLLLSNNDRTGIEQILRNVATRQKQVRSIGVRRADGVVVVAVGDHNTLWPVTMGDNSNATFMQVPLSHTSEGTWGKLEVSFVPLDSGRWYAFAENAQLQLLLFVAVSGFFSFRLFLKFVLKNLDPSRAVPRRVREALDILNEGLMIVSLDGRILLANNALARTARCPADSLVGFKAGEMSLQRTDNSTTMPWTECGLAERPVSGVTMDFVDESGEKRIFKVNCSPLFGNEGKIRGVMVSLDDVTQLEKNKIDLKLAKEEADAANKAKGDFLANMSHEIRNPMNAIVGFTDILRRGLEDSESTRTTYLDTIHASGTHLVELINDILDFSKIEAGKLELEIRECSPYQLMNEVVNVLSMKAEQQSLSLSINLRGTIPETIQADPTRLRQILMNLVGNAIKFTAEGGVRIVASMEDKEGQPFLRFEVTDTGIGMTQEQIGRLFQEFMQADSSVTRRFGGTGLGLAISKRLTEAMGGQIAVRSEPGVGSTFYFSIATGDLSGVPMLDAEQASEKFRAAARSKQHGLRVYFKTARVLITDDTPANRQLAGLVLRKAGLTVDEAENGAIAVEKASRGTYDLLLMDMQMPVMDGFTATRTLRDQGLKTPILAFTANVMEQDRQRCVAAGCSGFLTKPINIDLLLSTIAEYLETTDAPPELPAPVDHPVADNSRTEVSATPSASKSIAGSSLDEILDQLPGVAGIRELDRSQRLDSGSARGFRETVRRPIYSTLPLDIPEFREIVESFVGCMDDTMQSLRAAQARMDYQEVREIAHRLKGTGGTVGFAAFTEPSRKLQLAAEERDDATIEAMLLELEEISSRIELPTEV
jgi:PAS domain S-box-containing protein